MKIQMAWLTGTCLLAATLIGCGGGNSPDAAISEANQSNIQRIANLYVMYQMKHQFQGPKDEAEFKGYLNTLESDFLSRMGVDSVDDIFVSERDGQPLDIRYGLVSGPRGSTELVALEKQGSGGKHMVAYLNMTQREVDDSEYQDLLANGGNADPPSDSKSGEGDRG